MGAVAVTIKVMPESLEVDLETLKHKVRAALEPSFRSLEERPIAFGLSAIVAVAIIEDAEGGAERLEAALASLPGVGSVETIDVGLV